MREMLGNAQLVITQCNNIKGTSGASSPGWICPSCKGHKGRG